MSVSGSQVAEHYGSQVRAFSDLIDAHKQTLAKVRSADAAVEQELRAAVHDLAAIYLGSLEDASLARAAQRS